MTEYETALKDYRAHQIEMMKQCLSDAKEIIKENEGMAAPRERYDIAMIAISLFELRARPFYYWLNDNRREREIKENETQKPETTTFKTPEISRENSAEKLEKSLSKEEVIEMLKNAGWEESLTKPDLFKHVENLNTDVETVYFLDFRIGHNPKRIWASMRGQGDERIPISAMTVDKNRAVREAKKILEQYSAWKFKKTGE